MNSSKVLVNVKLLIFYPIMPEDFQHNFCLDSGHIILL